MIKQNILTYHFYNNMTDQVLDETISPIIMPDKAIQIMPPAPPQEYTFVPGKFNYIKDSHTKQMLVSAYNAITLTENWNFMKMNTGNYMFSEYPQAQQIYNKIEELGYNGHSACSFAFIMRDMKYIAKKGEEEFMKEYLLYQ